MKEKLNELLGYAAGTFIVSNILMIWLQGGGRYSFNSKGGLRLCLMVSVPITIVVAGYGAIKLFKKKK